MRKLVLLIMCVSSSFLASCAASMEEIAWDSRFVEKFRPTERILELTQGAVQNINKEYVCGDYTLRVAQILGDDKTVYIAADVIFPADVNFEGLPSAQLVDGVVSYDDIKDLTAREIENQYFYKGYRGSGGVQTVSNIYEENSMPYIFSFSIDSGRFSEDGLSLLVYGDNFSCVASWMPRHNSKILEWQLVDAKGREVGAVELSYFVIDVELAYSEFIGYEDLRNAISITGKDGQAFPIMGGGGGSGGGARAEATVLFNHLLPLEDIAYVQVGDYKLEVNI